MALVLNRKPDQALVFRTDQGLIIVKVISIQRGTAEIAIDAPESVIILREELVADKREGDDQGEKA